MANTIPGRVPRGPLPPVHDDLVRRRFVADARDRLCLTDITEHPTREGKVYQLSQSACRRPLVSRLHDAAHARLLACQKGEALFFARGNHIALRVEASPMEHALATTDPAELVDDPGS